MNLPLIKDRCIHNRLQSKWLPYLFILPFMISFFLFFLYPATYSLILSFFQYRGYGAMKFVGWNNYASLLQYGYFWVTLKNVLFYFTASFVPLMGISFILALILMSNEIQCRRVFKATIFMPQIMAFVCVALVWRIILSTRSGLFFQCFGFQIPFLTNPSLARWSVVFTLLWQGIGWYMVVFLAGLTSISRDVLEAAQVDGANGLKRITTIVLPMMKPTFKLAFVINAISAIKLSVEPGLLLSASMDAPEYAATSIGLLIKYMQGGTYGMASATGWILFMVILILSMVQYKLLGEENT